MIAIFLINKLHTQVLNHTSPFESLYHTKPNSKLLRVFDCACFPHLRPYNKHKFAFRTTKCVFLGYNLVHEGYCCLSSSSQIYIAKSVSFDEDCFPFATSFQVKRFGTTDFVFTTINGSTIFSMWHVPSPNDSLTSIIVILPKTIVS